MKIYIDADGCPVVDNTIRIAGMHGIECIIICDTAHVFEKSGATTITVSAGADSADFKIINMLSQGDIVITQDYGLAAMCLAKNAHVLNQNGMVYNSDNIDSLLSVRHIAKMERIHGSHMKGPKKRSQSQNLKFEKALSDMIDELL